MIRKVRKSSEARKVAIRIFNSFVIDDLLKDDVKDPNFEIGVLPAFTLSARDSANFDLEKSLRSGWRFICLNSALDQGAIINVRRSRWRKPKFAGYSVGRKALRHHRVTQQALVWAQDRSEDYVARLLVIQEAHIELLWLKPIRSAENSRFYLLSSRGIDPDAVPEFVRETCSRKLNDAR